MVARAFESWVEDQLKEKGYRSDYLVCGTGDARAFPMGEERKKINDCMDTLIDEVKKHILK